MIAYTFKNMSVMPPGATMGKLPCPGNAGDISSEQFSNKRR
jgi:hypothetical protein